MTMEARAIRPPVVRIRPGKTWVALELKDLWVYRDLLYFLTWRDIKVRYKQTLLGIGWAIIQPLLAMLLFTLFFGKLGNIPSDGVPYPIFAYAGLLPWMFFSNAVTNSGNSLVGNPNLITKVYFPRMIIPTAAVGAGLVDFAIAFVILLGLMIYYHVPLTLRVMILPWCIALTALLALGVGMWISAINVKYRDVRYAVPFLVQLWMFASPVIYPASLMPQKWRWILWLNPLTGIIEGFRTSLLGVNRIDWSALALASAITIVVLIYSAYHFRRMERVFADVV